MLLKFLIRMNILCAFVFTCPFYVLISVTDCLSRAKLAVLSSLSPPVWWSAVEVHCHYLFLFIYLLQITLCKKCCCHSSLPIWNCGVGTVFWHMTLLSSIFSFHLSTWGDTFNFVSLTRITPVCFSCAHHFRIINALNLSCLFLTDIYKHLNSLVLYMFQFNSIFLHTFFCESLTLDAIWLLANVRSHFRTTIPLLFLL